MSGKSFEDRERLDQHLRAELCLPLKVLICELPKEPHELAHAAELRKEGSVRVVPHEDAHALQHSQLAVPRPKALPIRLREEPLLHQQLEYHAEALARRLEGRGAAEVVSLAVLQEKVVELFFLFSRRLSQQLAEEGGHRDGRFSRRAKGEESLAAAGLREYSLNVGKPKLRASYLPRSAEGPRVAWVCARTNAALRTVLTWRQFGRDEGARALQGRLT